MTDQPSLFDKASHHLPPAALEDLDRAFRYFEQHGLPFTAESLRDRLTASTRATLTLPEHHNALGGWIQSLARARRIAPEGWTDSHREAARGRPLRRWRIAA